MNDCPNARPSSAPTVRPVRSRPPPGWAGTMIFTGFEGYVCAAASAGSRADVTRSEAAKRTIMTVLVTSGKVYPNACEVSRALQGLDILSPGGERDGESTSVAIGSAPADRVLLDGMQWRRRWWIGSGAK